MKISSIIVATLSVSGASAFTVNRPTALVASNINVRHSGSNVSPVRALFFAEEETKEKSDESKKPESKSEDSKKTESDEVESMAGSKESGFESMSGTIYDKIGFKEEQLAIGIDPDMVCCVKNIIMSIEYEIHV